MGELLDAFSELLENFERGLTIFTAGSFVIVIIKLIEGYKQKQVEAEMRRDIKAIKQKLGVEECGPQSECQTVQASLRRLFLSFSAGIYRVENQSRRGKGMQISKTWLAGLIAYILGIISQKFGITFGDQAADAAANVIITIILPLVLAFMNRKKVKSDEVRPTDTKSAV